MTTSVIPSADVNADLARRVMVHSDQMAWQPSPSGTVWRKPLYREGGEFGAVTSVVRYVPGGRFSPHPHPAGEEILVLSGVFSDEHGDYPSGSWLFNPEGFVHAPYSDSGCELFVRLRQYPGAGRPPCRVDTHMASWFDLQPPGLSLLPLFRENAFPEFMALVRLAPGGSLAGVCLEAGLEYFVLEGAMQIDNMTCTQGTWLRLPPSTPHTLSTREGALYYLRLGHGAPGIYTPTDMELNQSRGKAHE